jgi:hypothetical protein
VYIRRARAARARDRLFSTHFPPFATQLLELLSTSKNPNGKNTFVVLDLDPEI